MQNIHSLSACCEVPIWHVVTAIGSVTGLLAIGQVYPIIPLCLVDQSWLVFSLHGCVRRASTMQAWKDCYSRTEQYYQTSSWNLSQVLLSPSPGWCEQLWCSDLALLLNVCSFMMEIVPALETNET